MKLKFTLSLILLGALSLCALGVKSLKSYERKKKISDIVKAYHRAGENLSDPDVRTAIITDISKFLPMEPKEKPDLRSSEEIASEVRQIVDDKFSRSVEEVRKNAQKEAEKLFKLCKPLDYVTVLYQRGDTIYKVEGVFYEYGGNSVQIDDKIVAIFDLLPKYRVLFDKRYCSQKKKEYISNKIQEYYQQKGKFSTQLFKDLKEKQQETNEKRGFIYAWKEWRTPKDVTEIVMQLTMRGKEKVGKKDIDRVLRNSKRGGDTQTTSEKTTTAESREKTETTVASANTEAETKETDDDGTPYDKVKAKAESQLMKIANTYAGIDADQGYKNALWGFNWKEVALILKDELGERDLDKADEYNARENWIETIKYSSGALQEVQLYFHYGVFYKVIVIFRIGPIAAMRQVSLRMQERYGMTDEQKAERGKASSTPSEEELMKKKKDDKKKKKKKNEKAVPLHQVFHWTGEVTHGTLDVKINSDRTAYQSFSLTKENPTLFDKVSADKERERKLKEHKAQMEKIKEFEKKFKKIDF